MIKHLFIKIIAPCIMFQATLFSGEIPGWVFGCPRHIFISSYQALVRAGQHNAEIESIYEQFNQKQKKKQTIDKIQTMLQGQLAPLQKDFLTLMLNASTHELERGKKNALLYRKKKNEKTAQLQEKVREQAVLLGKSQEQLDVEIDALTMRYTIPLATTQQHQVILENVISKRKILTAQSTATWRRKNKAALLALEAIYNHQQQLIETKEQVQ